MGDDDRDALRGTGLLLFGERWQSDLARALGTSARMIRYWLAGTHLPPADLQTRLTALLKERILRMQEMLTRLGTAEKDGDR